MTEPICSICGAAESRALPGRRIRGGDPDQCVLICKSCSAVFIWPRWDDVKFSDFYKKQYREVVGISAEETTVRSKFIQNTLRGAGIAEFVMPFLQNRSTAILDLGAGEGGVLNAFKQRGFTNLSALEPNVFESEFCRSHVTEKVVAGLLQDHSLSKGEFDLALIVASLDHFQTPMSQLTQVRELLRPDGLIYVDGYDLMQAIQVGFEQFKVDHCYYYNAPLIAAMLYAVGFTPIRFIYDNLYSFELQNPRYVRRLDNCCFRVLARRDVEPRPINDALACFAQNRHLEVKKYLRDSTGLRRLFKKVYAKIAYAA